MDGVLIVRGSRGSCVSVKFGGCHGKSAQCVSRTVELELEQGLSLYRRRSSLEGRKSSCLAVWKSELWMKTGEAADPSEEN